MIASSARAMHVPASMDRKAPPHKRLEGERVENDKNFRIPLASDGSDAGRTVTPPGTSCSVIVIVAAPQRQARYHVHLAPHRPFWRKGADGPRRARIHANEENVGFRRPHTTRGDFKALARRLLSFEFCLDSR
ncbi:MAG: hypothetical protein IT428_23710 [Planctomycetaceae bacterium]|nr:hypothetical protein [Planctomycetaceae bacterium]